MNVYLARHAEAEHNLNSICSSDPSIVYSLTKLGIEQAEALAEKLKDVPFDKIYVSQLTRTQETAEIVKKYHQDVQTIVDARLNDNITGFEGQPSKGYYAAIAAAEDKLHVRFNDGESLEEVRQRVTSFINDLKTQNYQTVLLVTSLIVIQEIFGIANDLDDEDRWNYPVTKASCRVVTL
jgi:broad specificity phosphatase PhoE